jgi:hypothetical protein
LLNTGKWQGKTWNAIGIAVYENYACAWFGEAKDPEGNAVPCGTNPAMPASEPTAPAATKPSPATSETKTSTPDSVPVTYFIIVKTNLTREASEKLVATLKAGSYPGARVLEKDGKLRVSVFESHDRNEVTSKLREVKKTYKDAWMLKTGSAP